jgi:pimeloyl-ACP methyl ester carboxylesterase
MPFEGIVPYASINGLTMYYEVHGDGPPMLLLHGGTGSIPEAWIPHFSPRFRIVAPEFMGHGRTADAMDRPFHYHDLAEDTTELMRQLEIERAVIVGYSDGGIIGLDMAIHHPERVTRLVTTGANTRVDGYTAENSEWIRTFDPAAVAVSGAYARLSPDGPEHWPVLLARLKPMWTVEPHFTHEELGRIEAPTLIIIGDGDIITPEHAVEMFRTIPDARLCVVPDAGHGAMPADVVLQFLEETIAVEPV